MSYIEREPLLEILNGLYDNHLTMRNYSADSATQDCINSVIEAPTADVVPKSDAEFWKQSSEEFSKVLSGIIRSHYEVRQEVAREIFAELETKAPWFCENQTAYEHFNEELAELKKKYTE